MPHGWDNFFIMVGTAGATLIGLLFIIITLGAGLPDKNAEQGLRTFLTPTFTHFGGVLFQALAMLVPWPSGWPAGCILLAIGVLGLAWQIHILRLMRALAFVSLHTLDWIPYVGMPLLSSASLIAGGIGFLMEKSFAPYAVAGASAVLLLAGIYGAWDLTLWIVRNRDRPGP